MGLISKNIKDIEKKLQKKYEKEMDNAQKAWKAGYFRGNDVRLFDLYVLMMSNPVSTSTMNFEEKNKVKEIVESLKKLSELNKKKIPYNEEIDNYFKTILT